MNKKTWHMWSDQATGGVVVCAMLLLYGVGDLVDKCATHFGVDLSAPSDIGLLLHGGLLVVLYYVLKLHLYWYKEAIDYLYRGEDKGGAYDGEHD